MKLRLHRLAVEEIDHEIAYYAVRDSNVAIRLEDDLRSLFRRLLQMPTMAQRWKSREGVRVALVPDFPFTVPYVILGEELVVLALAHMRRRPGYWSRRAP